MEYMKNYDEWINNPYFDDETKKELLSIKNNEKEITHYSREQVYIALGTMLTTSALIGIDSCTIGGYDAKAVIKILSDRNLLDTNHFNISCMLALGYRNENPAPKTRRSFEDVVEFVK